MKGLNVNLLAFLSLLNGCPAMSHLLTAHCLQYIDKTVRPTTFQFYTIAKSEIIYPKNVGAYVAMDFA